MLPELDGELHAGVGALRRRPAPLGAALATDHDDAHGADGLFAELYRVGEGEKTEDQVAAVNTDHRGHEGAVMVRETGTFWLDMESWSERTEWEIEACYPADGSG